MPDSIPSICMGQHSQTVAVRELMDDHSHEFQLIAKAFDVTSDDPKINPPEIYEGQENPSRRDTITIPPSGYVVLRWRADNPGAWFFHCHVRDLHSLFRLSLTDVDVGADRLALEQWSRSGLRGGTRSLPAKCYDTPGDVRPLQTLGFTHFR